MDRSRLPKVHVLCPGGALQCYTYLVDGPEGAVMVDPGSSTAEDRILQRLGDLGRSIGEVGYALITHCHVDHALGAYRFQEMGVRLVSSPRTAELLASGSHQVWYEYPHRVVPTRVDRTAGDGDVLHLRGMDIQVVHTPGHTLGCASYLVGSEEGLVAFTGDLYDREGRLAWAGSEDFSEALTLRSLRKLLAFRPDIIATGHGLASVPGVRWLQEGIAKGQSGQWTKRTEFLPAVYPAELLRTRQREN